MASSARVTKTHTPARSTPSKAGHPPARRPAQDTHNPTPGKNELGTVKRTAAGRVDTGNGNKRK